MLASMNYTTLLILLTVSAYSADGYLLAVRHCEPDSQSGALTSAGIVQAEVLADRLKGTKFTKVVCTSLIRTYETAKIIRDRLGLQVRIETNDVFNQDVGGPADWVPGLKLLANNAGDDIILLVTHAPVLDALFKQDKVDASIDYEAGIEIRFRNNIIDYKPLLIK